MKIGDTVVDFRGRKFFIHTVWNLQNNEETYYCSDKTSKAKFSGYTDKNLAKCRMVLIEKANPIFQNSDPQIV